MEKINLYYLIYSIITFFSFVYYYTNQNGKQLDFSLCLGISLLWPLNLLITIIKAIFYLIHENENKKG